MKRLKWRLGSVCLEIVLILKQDRCTICMEHTIAQKLIWTHQMELLDDMCHMESHFGPFRDSVSFGATLVHGLHLMHPRIRNHFGCTRWYS